MNLQNRLKECLNDKSLRDGKEVKAADLARAIDKSRATVAAWLSGRALSIYGDVLFDVANFFQVNPNWLQSGIGDKYASDANELQKQLKVNANDEGEINLNTGLVNDNNQSMLENANTVTRSPTREDGMSLTMIQQMYSINKPNVLHAISLLLILNEAKDEKRLIRQAMDALSLSLDDSQSSRSKPEQENPAKKSTTT